MSGLNVLLAVIFPAIVIVAALRDATTMTIPNWLCATGAALFPAVAMLSGMSLAQTGLALAVGFAFLLVGMGLFAAGWVGGGDAKLFAVCGLWLGLPNGVAFVAWTAIAGGVLAVSLLWGRRWAAAWPSHGPAWLGRLLTPGGDVPYGLAIAAGALTAFPDSPIMLSLRTATGL